ncbi:MAG: hypothetical protein EXS10_03775 [Phycisphaerales bacterium]|nr:hypothetical protein [Phycisphaerales bacterium]
MRAHVLDQFTFPHAASLLLTSDSWHCHQRHTARAKLHCLGHPFFAETQRLVPRHILTAASSHTTHDSHQAALRDFLAFIDRDAVANRVLQIDVLRELVPQRFARAILQQFALDPLITPQQLPRERRQVLVHAFVSTLVEVTGDRGFTYAEVTAGGVPVDEIDLSTMESRVQRGLFSRGRNSRCRWTHRWIQSSMDLGRAD